MNSDNSDKCVESSNCESPPKKFKRVLERENVSNNFQKNLENNEWDISCNNWNCVKEDEGNTSDVGSGCGVEGDTITNKNFANKICTTRFQTT